MVDRLMLWGKAIKSDLSYCIHTHGQCCFLCVVLVGLMTMCFNQGSPSLALEGPMGNAWIQEVSCKSFVRLRYGQAFPILKRLKRFLLTGCGILTDLIALNIMPLLLSSVTQWGIQAL